MRRRVPLSLRRRWWRLRDALLARRVALARRPEGREPSAASRPAAVTDLLYARLTEDEAAALERELAASPHLVELPHPPGSPAAHARVGELWSGASRAERRSLGLSLGLHLGLPGVQERTGLVPATPPDTVHDMAAAGPLGTGGSLYHADLVIDALGPPPAGASWLDFGCSSGRVARVLAAAFPEARWHGCDPNAAAVSWAGEHLPGIDFAVSRLAPPLDYADGAFDAVFAISIWSHFGEPAAVAWLEEMHRVVRPGGRLLLTAHGFGAVAHYARHRQRSPLAMQETLSALYERGFAFRETFDAAAGDWGVRSSGWGESFLSPEWLLEHATPEWAVTGFRPAANEGNQDVYVLKRR